MIELSAHNTRTSERAGFTLLELMIVMTILALITATVTPVFSRTFNGFQAENETRDLVSFLEYAQNRSVTDAAEYRVFLVPAMNIYWLEKAIVRDGVSADFEVVKDRLIEERTLPDLVEMAVPRARRFQGKKVYYISFYPNGMCDDALIALKYIEDDSIFLISTEGSRIRWVKGETS